MFSVAGTHTIHIPVMEKADRLTGRTIQAVIGLAGGWLCPEHGVRRGLRQGAATRREGSGGGGRGGEGRWGGSLTHRDTHRGGHERKKKGGMAQLFCSTGPCNQQQPDGEKLIKYMKNTRSLKLTINLQHQFKP